MAKFFKSSWFKCIIVLMALAVILGGTLAVLNDVLYVSDSERTGRAIKKIYGEEKEYVTVIDDGKTVDGELSQAKTYKFGKISKVYNIGEDVLFQATGYDGYKGGTITLWIKVVKQNGNSVIDKVVLESYEKQTLMSKLSGTFYENFFVDVTKAYQDGTLFTPNIKDTVNIQNPIASATKSANAACNAVNCVITYLGEQS